MTTTYKSNCDLAQLLNVEAGSMIKRGSFKVYSDKLEALKTVQDKEFTGAYINGLVKFGYIQPLTVATKTGGAK